MPVHNEIKCVHLLCTLHAKNQRLNSYSLYNLVVSPDIMTLSMASSADLTTESGSFWTEATTNFVLSVTEWLVSNAATRSLICRYKLRIVNKTLPPLHIFVSWNPIWEALVLTMVYDTFDITIQCFCLALLHHFKFMFTLLLYTIRNINKPPNRTLVHESIE